MARHPDRYELRELTGYNITKTLQASGAHETTDVMLLDRDDCYRVVGFWPSTTSAFGSYVSLDERRREAQARCDALNEEHRRWKHAGRWT